MVERGELVERLASALKDFVYETTHLSPERADGSHDCRIPAATLAKGRAALALLKAGETQ